MGLEPPPKGPTLEVWMIVLGETVTRENFEVCSQAVDKSCVPKNIYLKGETAWRYILSCLLPQFAMRQRHVARKFWSFARTKVVDGSGKAYLSMKYDPIEPRNDKPAMGFSWGEAGVAMAFAQSFGQRDVVINIGVGIQLTKPVVSASAYIQSHLHKLTQREEPFISIAKYGEARAVHRLNIILSVKDAYLKAVGQPAGFDLSRITCDVGKSSVSVDGSAIDGWEFRIFTANLDSHRRYQGAPIPKHLRQYLVTVAAFRGGKRTKFIWPKENEMGFVQFFDVDQIVKDVPRLGEYDNAPMPPLDQIPLSNKSSLQTLTPDAVVSKTKSTSEVKQQSYDAKYPIDNKYPSETKHAADVKLADPYSNIPPPSRPHPQGKQHKLSSRTVPIHNSDQPYAIASR